MNHLFSSLDIIGLMNSTNCWGSSAVFKEFRMIDLISFKKMTKTRTLIILQFFWTSKTRFFWMRMKKSTIYYVILKNMLKLGLVIPLYGKSMWRKSMMYWVKILPCGKKCWIKSNKGEALLTIPKLKFILVQHW